MYAIIMFFGFAFVVAAFGCIVLIFQARDAKGEAAKWKSLYELEHHSHIMNLKSHVRFMEELNGRTKAEYMKNVLEQMRPEQFRVI